MNSCTLLALLIAHISSHFCVGIWTQFDLVRPFKAWGSNWTEPFSSIYPGVNNSMNVPKGAQFGFSVCDINDFDGDGIHDLAVGAPIEGITSNGAFIPQTGAIYILLMFGNGNLIFDFKANRKASVLVKFHFDS